MGEEKLSFDGRVAIVTGAKGKLGRDCALSLASRGAKVVGEISVTKNSSWSKR